MSITLSVGGPWPHCPGHGRLMRLHGGPINSIGPGNRIPARYNRFANRLSCLCCLAAGRKAATRGKEMLFSGAVLIWGDGERGNGRTNDINLTDGETAGRRTHILADQRSVVV